MVIRVPLLPTIFLSLLILASDLSQMHKRAQIQNLWFLLLCKKTLLVWLSQILPEVRLPKKAQSLGKFCLTRGLKAILPSLHGFKNGYINVFQSFSSLDCDFRTLFSSGKEKLPQSNLRSPLKIAPHFTLFQLPKTCNLFRTSLLLFCPLRTKPLSFKSNIISLSSRVLFGSSGSFWLNESASRRIVEF